MRPAADNWLDARALPYWTPPPRGLPPTADARPAAYYDPTTENRDLIVVPPPIRPLPPVSEEGDVNTCAPPQFGAPKEGVFQQLSFTKTVLLGGAGDNISFLDFALKSTFGFPLPTRDAPLLVSPGFTAHLLDGPTSTDLPGHLFETFVEFRHLRRINSALAIDLAFLPGIFGDYAFINSTTWRYQGRGAVVFTCNPALQLVAGIAYIDRENIRYLPIAGLIWVPNDKWRIEAIAPRPRIAHQFAGGSRRQWWSYLAGEFGGNSYSILRATGEQDVATYQDLRMLVGIERKTVKGHNISWEAGYVFARHLEYKSGTPSLNPGETVLLRASTVY